jgi:general nucleoside transport system ATP-binding protein
MIELNNITKKFGAVAANKAISLKIPANSIHAIVGENGAGKSTIMKILYGFYTADEGEIFVDGAKQNIRNPQDAIKLGIGMVHQHFMLVQTMSVLENIILGAETTTGGRIDYDNSAVQVQKVLDDFGFDLDLHQKIEDLSVGQQQRVEVVKALYRGANILILDEPTAVLTPPEVEEFFRILRGMKAQGKTIIIITHKLNEVLAISDNITVMRDGKVVGNLVTAKTSPAEIARLMVGRDVLLRVDKPEAKPSDAILQVENLRVLNQSEPLSFNVHGGEIVGIAGVEGNGQTELIEILAGLKKITSGNFKVSGQNCTNLNPRKIKELGVAHIPEDRHRRGLLLDFDLTDNSILGTHYRNPAASLMGFLNNVASITKSKRLIHDFDVRPANEALSAKSLSGGNQQKLIIGREFDIAPKLLLVSQPTRGVDIGAIEFIHRKLVELRDSGAAILLVSAELEEVLSLSDRVLVMYQGKIVGEVDPKKVSQEEIGLMMTGGR